MRGLGGPRGSTGLGRWWEFLGFRVVEMTEVMAGLLKVAAADGDWG